MTSPDGVGGVLQLLESNISDEEIHALAALLRNNTSIDELNLCGNNITDDGARALAAALSGKSGLRLVDLRGNKIGKSAIRILAEALERSERVRHVYVHAGGKIEALGTAKWAKPRLPPSSIAGGATGTGTGTGTGTVASLSRTGDDDDRDDIIHGNGNGNGNGGKQVVNVETICVVDIRDNFPSQTKSFDMDSVDMTRDRGEGIAVAGSCRGSGQVTGGRGQGIPPPSEEALLRGPAAPAAAPAPAAPYPQPAAARGGDGR